jgi:hypothetical protein
MGSVASSAATPATVPAPASPAAATTSAAAATTTVSTAPAPAFGFGTSFIYVKRSAADFFPIYGVYRIVPFRVIRHLDKGKPSGLAGFPVRNDVDTIYRAMSFEQRADILLGSLETEVAYKNILHLCFPLHFKVDGFANSSSRLKLTMVDSVMPDHLDKG